MRRSAILASRGRVEPSLAALTATNQHQQKDRTASQHSNTSGGSQEHDTDTTMTHVDDKENAPILQSRSFTSSSKSFNNLRPTHADTDDSSTNPDVAVTQSTAKEAFMKQKMFNNTASSASVMCHVSASAASAVPAVSSAPANSVPAFSPAKKFFNNQSTRVGSGIVPRGGIAAAVQNMHNSAQDKPEKYFMCNWTARSTKKHKNYDDGVLIIQGRRCTLKDMSGATIGSQLMSQSTEKLQPGTMCFVGSHEVEVGEPLADAEYLSGRVFVGTTYALKIDDDKGSADSTTSPAKSTGKTGRALFSKQPLANKPQVKKPDRPLDPSILLLNQEGIEKQGENAVVVDLCLSKHLRAHQRAGVQFMYDCVMGRRCAGYEGCILADAMGLGKTLQAIALAWTLLNYSPTQRRGGHVQKVLIVCPATLVRNWQKEFTTWLGIQRCKPLVLMSSMPQAEQQQMIQDFMVGLVNNVLIVGYELFRKHHKALHSLPNPLLILDEAHRLKSTNINQTIKSLMSIPTKKRVMLTGTPVQNDLSEFYAMCNFVNPGILGNLTTFSRTMIQPINRSRDTTASAKEKQIGEYRSRELSERTAAFVLRRGNDIMLQYLPEKVEQILFIPLTPIQAEIYRALLRGKAIRQMLARSGEFSGNDAVALQAINSLKKLCNHPGLVYEEAKGYAGSEPKSAFSFYPANYVPQVAFTDIAQSSKLAVLDHLLASIRAEGKKVVVVSNYIQTLDMLATYLNSKGYQFLRLDGQTPAADRLSIVDRFNASYEKNAFVFLLSAKAGGVGLNLIGGNRLILFDPEWNPAVDLQAMSRVWRDGQRETVYIYRLLCTATIDEKIFQRQIRKNELSQSVMTKGNEEAIVRNFDTKSLKQIFTYQDVTNCETRDILMRTKKQTSKQEDEEEDMDENGFGILGDFHERLDQALDPILKSMSPHLVSAFLNRVSSAEENLRALNLLAERLQRRRDAEAKKANADVDAAEVAFVDDDVDDMDLTESNQEPAAVAATASVNDMCDDDDEGEAEWEMSALPPAATASTNNSNGASGNVDDAMEVDADESSIPRGSIKLSQTKLSASPNRKRRHIIDEVGEQSDPHNPAAATTNGSSTVDHVHSGSQDGESLPDWMRLDSSLPNTPNTASKISHSQPDAPIRSFSYPSLDAAAAMIAPLAPPEPEAQDGMVVEFTLDTIEGGARGQIRKRTKHE